MKNILNDEQTATPLLPPKATAASENTRQFTQYRLPTITFLPFAIESYGYVDCHGMEPLRRLATAASSAGRPERIALPYAMVTLPCFDLVFSKVLVLVGMHRSLAFCIPLVTFCRCMLLMIDPCSSNLVLIKVPPRPSHPCRCNHSGQLLENAPNNHVRYPQTSLALHPSS